MGTTKKSFPGLGAKHAQLRGDRLIWFFSEDWLVLGVYEAKEAVDLNGDGDMQEGVLHVHEFASGQTRNMRAAASFGGFISSREALLAVSEFQQGMDLDGSGRIDASAVLHVGDMVSGQLTGLAIQGEGFVDSKGRFLVDLSERVRKVDLNGDGRLSEESFHLAEFALSQGLPSFIRGDCDGDGNALGITDAVFLLSHGFRGGDTPPCLAACDHDGDGNVIGVTDAIYLLNHFFLGGTAPPRPYPECATSTLVTDADLGCAARLACP